MSSEILVSPVELREHATAVKTQATDATTAFNSMKGRLDALSGQFKGKAAAAFELRWNEWHTNATGLIQALEGLGSFLNASADTIEGVDEQLAQGLKG